jgi:hypothetical protein
LKLLQSVRDFWPRPCWNPQNKRRQFSYQLYLKRLEPKTIDAITTSVRHLELFIFQRGFAASNPAMSILSARNSSGRLISWDTVINTRVIGPRPDYEDHAGGGARSREMGGSGCQLVRPGQHLAFRAMQATSGATKELANAFNSILGT